MPVNTRSGDRTLAAAIAARALALVEPPGVMVSNGWRTVVNDYAEQFPSDEEYLADLLALHERQTVRTVFAYMPPF